MQSYLIQSYESKLSCVVKMSADTGQSSSFSTCSNQKVQKCEYKFKVQFTIVLSENVVKQKFDFHLKN